MLFLYAVARPILSSANTTTTSTFISNASEACEDITGCRTMSDIFLSCFTVILISVWVSMHPDVPDVRHIGESDVGSFLNQLIIMTLSFLFPECIAIWALQQRMDAETIARKYEGYGWTNAHAYLAIMGGLALYDKNGDFRGYLDDSDDFEKEDCALAEEIEQWLRGRSHSKIVEADVSSVHPSEEPKEEEHLTPKPSFLEPYSCLLEYMLSRGLVNLTEAEIKSSISHGDVFAKLSALLSTGWFLVQVIAHGIQGLVISELEVVTLSFTALNIAAYVIWWNKPQRVRYPVRVTWEPMPPKFPSSGSARQSLWEQLHCRLVADFNSVVFKDAAAGKHRHKTWMLSKLGLYPFIFMAHKLEDLVGLWRVESRRARRTPTNMFNSGEEDGNTVVFVGILLGIVVGAVHFVAWESQFPTTSLRIAWLVSASVLGALPVTVSMCSIVESIFKYLLPPVIEATISTVWGCVAILLTICYPIARLTLFVLAIYIPSKYGLSESAYHAVEWTHYIPHIG
ncbi:hypothetical protein V5O48_007555 [Marasmius crinis-equi]|uniref:Uncharacterized protein n=1 Tax=Marasmius crinis-equi TaxID=585013 RepID=A0ABR3FGY6_9AGAR